MYTENMDYYLHQIYAEASIFLDKWCKIDIVGNSIQFKFIYVYSAIFRILFKYN